MSPEGVGFFWKQASHDRIRWLVAAQMQMNLWLWAVGHLKRNQAFWCANMATKIHEQQSLQSCDRLRGAV